MSIADTNICMTFSEDTKTLEKFKKNKNIAYTAFKKDGKIYLFKIKIKEAQLAYNAFSKNSIPRSYISFNIIFEEEIKKVEKDGFKNFLFFRIPKYSEKTYKYNKELEVPHYFFTPGFYSEFWPTGFLSCDEVFLTENEAIDNYLENNILSKYIYYSLYSV